MAIIHNVNVRIEIRLSFYLAVVVAVVVVVKELSTLRFFDLNSSLLFLSDSYIIRHKFIQN